MDTSKQILQEEQRLAIRLFLSVYSMAPTELARRARLAPSTLNRFLNQEVKHVLSTTTMGKLFDAMFTEIDTFQKNADPGIGPSDLYRLDAVQQLKALRKRTSNIAEFRFQSDRFRSDRLDFDNPGADRQRLHWAENAEFTDPDLPVLGDARAGADGFFFDNGIIKEYVPRPASLLRVPNAYAVYVNGDNMENRYFHGEIVYVNPNRPPKTGDFVIIEFKDEQGLIKRLIRHAGNTWYFQQFKPAKKLEFKDDDIKHVHLIVASATLTR